MSLWELERGLRQCCYESGNRLQIAGCNLQPKSISANVSQVMTSAVLLLSRLSRANQADIDAQAPAAQKGEGMMVDALFRRVQLLAKGAEMQSKDPLVHSQWTSTVEERP